MPLPAAGGRLDYHVAAVFDSPYYLAEEPDVRARFPRLRFADVEVDDGRPGLVRPDGGVDYLIRRSRGWPRSALAPSCRLLWPR